MTITICGSMHFAKEMIDVQKQLEELGYNVLMPLDTEECVINPLLSEDYEFVTGNNAQMDHFNKVGQSDAVLVLNYPKNEIKGYIGGSTLMEIGLAKYLGKKIFILYDLPDENIIRHAFEVKLTQPITLNGDITKINNYLDL